MEGDGTCRFSLRLAIPTEGIDLRPLPRRRHPCQHPRMNHDDLNAVFARRLLAVLDALAVVKRPVPVPHGGPGVLDG